MSSNIILTFSLLFGATMALICAVYVYLIMIRISKARGKTDDEEL